MSDDLLATIMLVAFLALILSYRLVGWIKLRRMRHKFYIGKK